MGLMRSMMLKVMEQGYMNDEVDQSTNHPTLYHKLDFWGTRDEGRGIQSLLPNNHKSNL